jgi:hypothetical protein
MKILYAYEGESVNKSQMTIIRKTCDIWTWKNNLFLDISSTNCDILVPSLCLCVETRSIEAFWSLSHLHPRTSLTEFLDPAVNRFTRQTLPTLNRKHFFTNILCIESFCPQKNSQENAALRYYALKHDRHCDWWSQLVNMHIYVCFLHWEEAGLYCYLVIHIGKELRSL